ncbi:hypothetical protein CBL_06014 [Carabus blaptoides fortunei]
MCSESNEPFTNGQWLINDVHTVVDEAIMGLVRCNPHLALLDIGRVVIRRDHQSHEGVKILSGGASGHEPCFAGFVGRGMLTAAVQGGIYSSPTSYTVVRTIKELSRRHEHGILIIVSNNMSDRLNFGLAVERANNLPNVQVKLLCVSDVCGNKSRSLTGTLLVQKIAGAMAETDASLYDIHTFCSAILCNLATVLVSVKFSLSPFPEIATCARFLGQKSMEFGSGLHGEAGYLTTKLKSTEETVKMLIAQLTDKHVCGTIELTASIPIIVLVNNLGNTSKLEEHLFLNELIIQLQSHNINICKIYCGSFLTSLEMAGFSLTVLNVTDPVVLEYINAPCSAPYWKSFTEHVVASESVVMSTVLPSREKHLKTPRGPRINEKTANAIQTAIKFACGALISCEKQLNLIDSEFGDSDTGTNLKKGCVNILEYLTRDKLTLNWPFMLFEEISKILERKADGLLCCLYSIMFASAAKPLVELTEYDDLTPEVWARVLEAVCSVVQSYGQVQLGQCTMYDALYACADSLRDNLNNELSSLDLLGVATIAAEDAARKTRPVQNVHPDPGAHAVGIWMRAVYEALKLQNWPLM